MLKYDDLNTTFGAYIKTVAYHGKNRIFWLEASKDFIFSLMRDQRNLMKTSSPQHLQQGFSLVRRHFESSKLSRSSLLFKRLPICEMIQQAAINLIHWLVNPSTALLTLKVSKKTIHLSSKKTLSGLISFLKLSDQVLLNLGDLAVLPTTLRKRHARLCSFVQQSISRQSSELSLSYRGIHEQTYLNQRHPCWRNLGHFCGKWYT